MITVYICIKLLVFTNKIYDAEEISFAPSVKSSRGHDTAAGALVTGLTLKTLFTSVWFIFQFVNLVNVKWNC